MLVKAELQNSIENALKDAMKNALMKMMEVTEEEGKNITFDSDGNPSSVIDSDKVADAFADEAKTCAADIATAIDKYIKSQTIQINIDTLPIAVGPTLACAVGPVTGAITLLTPAVLSTTIS